jgi:hypothetical protein
VDASAYTSGLVAVIVLAAFTVVLRTYGTATTARRDPRNQTKLLAGSARNQV